jgi:hypothetical protein
MLDDYLKYHSEYLCLWHIRTFKSSINTRNVFLAEAYVEILILIIVNFLSSGYLFDFFSVSPRDFEFLSAWDYGELGVAVCDFQNVWYGTVTAEKFKVSVRLFQSYEIPTFLRQMRWR